VTQWGLTCASAAANTPRASKIRLILEPIYYRISDIKLKRTDTTLDLSQKAVCAEGRPISNGYSRRVAVGSWRVEKTYQRELKRKEKKEERVEVRSPFKGVFGASAEKFGRF